MSLQSHHEVAATREKLRRLEGRYEANEQDQVAVDHVRDLSRRSLKRLINQLKEEIVRFEAHNSLGASRD